MSTGGGDAGVQREAGADTAGGGQSIAFIEDGDWWSVAPADLTNITEIRFRPPPPPLAVGSRSTPVLLTDRWSPRPSYRRPGRGRRTRT
ncbi:hypothetical protein NKG94_40920 [Micromonospora sp. M12]